MKLSEVVRKSTRFFFEEEADANRINLKISCGSNHHTFVFEDPDTLDHFRRIVNAMNTKYRINLGLLEAKPRVLKVNTVEDKKE